VAAVGLVAALSSHSSPPGSTGPSSALQRLEAANDSAAATWVHQQVSGSTPVSCDQQMCAALEAHGFPRASVLQFGSAPQYPLNSKLVIETATVRALFGTSLAQDYAPMILTTVGSGTAIIQIRVIASHGTLAYQRLLAADLSNRQTIGKSLLQSRQITTTPQAHVQLAAGQVDGRALIALLNLAYTEPLDILGFGNVATGESPGVPLRYVDLATSDKASGLKGSAYVDVLVKALGQMSASDRPIQDQTMKLSGDLSVLRITFPAPTPLGLLQPTG
jgi:hypothetical protein